MTPVGIDQFVEFKTEWASPEIKEYCELLQTEIRKAFTIPAYLLHDSAAFYDFYMRAHRSTELLHAQLVELTMRHSINIMIVKP